MGTFPSREAKRGPEGRAALGSRPDLARLLRRSSSLQMPGGCVAMSWTLRGMESYTLDRALPGIDERGPPGGRARRKTPPRQRRNPARPERLPWSSGVSVCGARGIRTPDLLIANACSTPCLSTSGRFLGASSAPDTWRCVLGEPRGTCSTDADVRTVASVRPEDGQQPARGRPTDRSASTMAE